MLQCASSEWAKFSNKSRLVVVLCLLPFQRYVSFVYQARVPVGKAILELPAGMLDDEAGDFVGTAAREVCSGTSALCASLDRLQVGNVHNLAHVAGGGGDWDQTQRCGLDRPHRLPP